VLVADDSASLRALVRITLTSQGWAVLEAETAQAARDIARGAHPDLVLLDITFGETGPDGLAICAALKADPLTAAIPVVILTAHDDPAERERASAAHADAFVGKPFGPLELMEVLRNLVPTSPAAPALGVYLLDAGMVEPTVLEAALDEQRVLQDRGTPRQLGDVLLAHGSISGSALDRALLEQMHERATRSRERRARVLIVDDHIAVREGLKSLIREEDTLEVVGEASSAADGLRLARRHRPDVIVIDNEMPGGSGVDVLPALRSEVPAAKLVMFSLDGGMRERALAAGAHLFVVKDAPMAQILEAIQPRGEMTAPAALGGTVVPPFRRSRELRRAAILFGAIFLVYVALFLVLEPGLGASAGAFAVLPVAIGGALLGPEAGLLAAVTALLVTAVLWSGTGHDVGEPVLQIGGAVGIVVTLVLGLASGAARVLCQRVDQRHRRVDAIVDAAQAISGLERGELIAVLLDAMLRVIPGDAVYFYSNAVSEPRFVASSHGGRTDNTDALVPLVRDVMRSSTPRTIDELAAPERPSAEARSASIVPVSIAAQEVRGALVVVHHQARHFGPSDIGLMQPFAQYLWIVLRSGPPIPAGGTLGRAREVPS
jgi:DNA-binding NarL/FixJ family response regulator